ncbi:MAG: leucine-rich repeat domain-containing protein, partial [Methylophagaceae bacterium]
PMIGFGQNVNIPDANFKAYLVGEWYINTNGDSEIQVSEASAYSSMLEVPFGLPNISNITGIEAFTALTGLDCSSIGLTSLDVSNNTALQYLYCSNNNIEILDVSTNIALTELFCQDNELTSLNVSNNIALSILVCDENELTSLDVSNNTALTELWCFNNELTSIDVSNNNQLLEMKCYDNQLTSLSVSSISLWLLYCYNNQLTSLDVSQNTALTDLDCHSNQLTILDLRNGNNTNFFGYFGGDGFNTGGNPNLSCISVDDANWSDANWLNIDSWTNFSSNCATAQNCQIIDSVIITNISCFGGVDGAIDIVLLNPVGLYSYAWNTVDVSQDINALPPNVYTVTITDLVDPTCTQDTSFEITQPQDSLSTETTLYTDVDCFGDSSGIAYAENAIGGTFPYTYAWDNGQNTQLAVNLWAGTHTVTVTDANGCAFQSSIDIVNSYPAITGIDSILNQVSCFGACDADVEFSAFGGQAPHTYTWDIGQVYYGSSGPDTAFNLCFGGHNILIEDAIGCKKTFTFTITQPDELFANAIGNGAPIPGQLPTQPVQCFGFDDGTAFAYGAQGTLGYTF